MTKQDKLLKELVNKLKLHSWHITLHIQSDEDYQNSHGKDFAFETNGCTEIAVDGGSADIYIRASLSEFDMHITMLHECMHLVTHNYDSFVRGLVSNIDSKKLKKHMRNDAMWEMEINVAKITAILRDILWGEEVSVWEQRKKAAAKAAN